MTPQKMLKMMDITQEEYKNITNHKKTDATLVKNMFKAYFSQVSKDQILGLLKEGFTFDYSDPKSKHSQGYINDTKIRLDMFADDVRFVALSYTMNLSLAELDEMKSNGLGYDELRFMSELNN